MPNIETIDPMQDPRWDAFVESHPYGWICHLSGWKKVLEESFTHMKGYYFVLSDNPGENIEAALPIFEVKSWLTGKRLVSMPFATLCDPLISTTDDMNELLQAVMKLSEKLKSRYIEIRTLYSSPLIQDERFGRSNFFKHHFFRLQEEPERMKKRFHRSCVRQKITRAEKNKLEKRLVTDSAGLLEFYRLQLITRKRLGLPCQPLIFFESLWRSFSPVGQVRIILAEKDNVAIAGLLIFCFKDRVSIEFAASDERFMDMCPNHFLIWETFKWAYEAGYQIVDFGRTSPNNEGLMDFKRRWGTTVIDLPQLFCPRGSERKIAVQERSWKFKSANLICKSTPVFLQQGIDNFMYRHLG